APTPATRPPPSAAGSTPRSPRTAPPEGARYDFTSPVARSMASLRAPPDRLGRREADDAEGGPRGRGRAQQDREGERPRDEARREVEELLARAAGPRIDGDTQQDRPPQASDTAAHRDHQRLAPA